MATQIAYQIDTKKILNVPYGKCLDENDEGSVISMFNQKYQYTEEVCRTHCATSAIFNACGCIHVETSKGVVLGDIQAHAARGNACLSFRRNTSELMEKYLCLQDVMQSADVIQSCYNSCPIRCKVNQYSTTVSSVKWPRKTQYNAIYESIIANKTFAWRYASLKKDCSRENCTLTERLEQQDLIKSNFAKVNIFLKNDRHITSEEKPKTTFSVLTSQLGATLNLWCGITVVILIEFVEYIILIFLEKARLRSNSVTDITGTKKQSRDI